MMEAAKQEAELWSLIRRQRQEETKEWERMGVKEQVQESTQICRWSWDPHLDQMWESKRSRRH